MTDGKFKVIGHKLTDGSRVFDVEFNGELIAAPQTQCAAEELAFALNGLLSRFLDCGSDREVSSLAMNFSRFLDTQKK